MQDMSAQHTDVTAGADPALTAGSSAGQAKIALPGNLGKDVAGEQAGAGSGDQLASHPLLSLVADVLPADATVPEALVDQLARKRRKKKGALHVSVGRIEKKKKRERRKEEKAKKKQTAQKKTSRDMESSSKAESGGNFLQAYSGDVGSPDDANVLPEMPKDRSVAQQPKRTALADPEAQTANLGTETAAMILQSAGDGVAAALVIKHAAKLGNPSGPAANKIEVEAAVAGLGMKHSASRAAAGEATHAAPEELPAVKDAEELSKNSRQQDVPVSGVTAKGALTPAPGPSSISAKIAAPGQAGMGAAGDQAGVSAGGDRLAMHLILPPPPDLARAHLAGSADPDAPPAANRIGKNSCQDMSEEDIKNREEKEKKKAQKKEKKQKKKAEREKKRAEKEKKRTEKKKKEEEKRQANSSHKDMKAPDVAGELAAHPQALNPKEQPKDSVPSQHSEAQPGSGAEAVLAANTCSTEICHTPVVCPLLSEAAKATSQLILGAGVSRPAPTPAVPSDACKSTIPPTSRADRSTASGCGLTGTTAKSAAQALKLAPAPAGKQPVQADAGATARSEERGGDSKAVAEAGPQPRKPARQQSEVAPAAQGATASQGEEAHRRKRSKLGMKCTYPVDRKQDAVELTEHDLVRLNDREMVNDSVVDFYVKWLRAQLDPAIAHRVHFFNSFFYKKLTEKPPQSQATSGGAGGPGIMASAAKPLTCAQSNHLRVKAWTKSVDIFSKDFLLIPIHGGLHWTLVIVCFPGANLEETHQQPYILHLDSLKGSSHNSLVISDNMRSYLNCEWQRKLDEQDCTSTSMSWLKEHPGMPHSFNRQNMPSRVPDVPRQKNGYDCGLFMLTFMDFWTATPPDQIQLDKFCKWMGDKPYPPFMAKHWFQHKHASQLRGHIRNLILELIKQQMNLPDGHPSMLAVNADLHKYRQKGPASKKMAKTRASRAAASKALPLTPAAPPAAGHQQRALTPPTLCLGTSREHVPSRNDHQLASSVQCQELQADSQLSKRDGSVRPKQLAAEADGHGVDQGAVQAEASDSAHAGASGSGKAAQDKSKSQRMGSQASLDKGVAPQVMLCCNPETLLTFLHGRLCCVLYKPTAACLEENVFA
ncbi:hypothetical protein ABBQ32_010855 [Trebouxia sp. C0010 RCD-2024]